jgi:hypothetical protein
MLDIGKINWQEYKTNVNKYFKNYNILSIGFCDNNLYMQLPCENNTKTNIITSEDNELRIDNDIWTHWIIVKKLNNIKIYKNLHKINVIHQILNMIKKHYILEESKLILIIIQKI